MRCGQALGSLTRRIVRRRGSHRTDSTSVAASQRHRYQQSHSGRISHARYSATLAAKRCFFDRPTRWKSVRRRQSGEILRWAITYENVERMAIRAGHYVDTTHLDAELAFKPWKSHLNLWAYDQAVMTGQVPPSSRESLEAWMLEDFFYIEATNFLEEASRELTDIPTWWQHAQGVMCFWLRRISADVEKWEQGPAGGAVN